MSDDDWSLDFAAEMDDQRNPLTRRPGASAPLSSQSEIDENLQNAATRMGYRQNLMAAAERIAELAADPKANYQTKHEALTNLVTSLLPLVIVEITATNPNPDASLAISRANSVLKELGNLFSVAEKAKQESTLNPHSPRFHDMMKMFFNEIQESFNDAQLPQGMKDQIYSYMEQRFRGWEEKVDSLNTTSAIARGRIGSGDLTKVIMVDQTAVSSNKMN